MSILDENINERSPSKLVTPDIKLIASKEQLKMSFRRPSNYSAGPI